MNDIEELKRLISDEREFYRKKRKACWHEDIEDKCFFDGKIEAFGECLELIKQTCPVTTN